MKPDEPPQLAPEIVEALHRSITSDTPFVADAVTAGDQLQAVRKCLQELEQLRCDGRWEFEWPLGLSDDAQETDDRPSRIGRFEIESELGRGGQGVVYLARDPDLGRHVAIKLPRLEMLASRELRKRVMREARAASALNHPAIVTVYEVGQLPPAVYLVSDYCSGGSLHDHLQSNGGRLEPRQAARLIAELADGVHYAHQHGVLHRDIKPSNVLLAPRHARREASEASHWLDRYAPRLTDFGLARHIEQGGDRTRSGTVLGTPSYMAPEQAGGEVDRIGPATDVYALGALLYEMLLGCPPFLGVTDADTLRLVLFEEPQRPRRVRPEIPPDLEAICLCALEKDPARRYSSAVALADDLRRFLAGEPTRVRPLTPATRVFRWMRRRPAWAAVVGVSAAALLTIAAGTLLYDSWLRGALGQLQQESQMRRRLNYANDIRLAVHARDQFDIPGMETALARQVPESGEEDLREFVWHYLGRSVSRSLLTLRGHKGDVHAVAWTPDGASVISGGKDGTIRIWDATSGEERLAIQTNHGEVNEVAVFDGGRRIASAGEDGAVNVWDSKNGAQVGQLLPNGGQVIALAASDTAGVLACGTADNQLHSWDTSSWQLLWRCSSDIPINSAVFSTDGQELLTAHPDGIACSRSVTTGERLWQSENMRSGSSSSVAYSPVANQVCVLHRKNGLQVFDRYSEWRPGAKLQRPESEETLHGIDISRRNGTIAFGSRSGNIYQCRARDTVSIENVRAEHSQRIWRLAWSPSGQVLASASADGTIKLWDRESPTSEAFMYPESCRNLRQVSISLDSRYILVRNRMNLIELWDRENRSLVNSWQPLERCLSATLLPGNDILIATRSGETCHYRAASKQFERGPELGFCDLLSVSADRTRMAISDGRQVVLRDTANPLQVLKSFAVRNEPSALALSADAGHLAVATMKPAIEVWNTATAELEFTIPLQRQIPQGCLVISPDNRQAIISDVEGNTRFHDMTNGRLITTTFVGKTVSSIAASMDGRTLAIAQSNPAKVQFFDLATYAALASLDVPANICALEFSQDNSALVAGGSVPTSAPHVEAGLLAEWAWQRVRKQNIATAKGPVPATRLGIDEWTAKIGPLIHARFRMCDDVAILNEAELEIRHLTINPLGRSRNEDYVSNHVFTVRLTDGEITKETSMGPFPRYAGESQTLSIGVSAKGSLTDQQLDSLVKNIELYLDLNGDQVCDPNVDRLLPVQRGKLQEGIIHLTIDAAALESIPPERERDPSERSFARLYRAAGEYARQQGFAHGYPVRIDREGGSANIVLIDRRKGHVMLEPAGAYRERASFPADQIDQDSLLSKMLKVTTEHHGVGPACIALPTFYAQCSANEPLAYEIFEFGTDAVVVTDFKYDDMTKDPRCEGVFQAVHEAGSRNPRFLSAFPSGSHYLHGDIHCLTVGLIPRDAGKLRTVPLAEIYQAIGE